MSEESKVMEDAVVTLQYTLRNVNELINAMNRPMNTPVMAWANYINDIHLQVAPQVQKLNEELETKDEPAA
jgi:hypothetical protein